MLCKPEWVVCGLKMQVTALGLYTVTTLWEKPKVIPEMPSKDPIRSTHQLNGLAGGGKGEAS